MGELHISVSVASDALFGCCIGIWDTLSRARALAAACVLLKLVNNLHTIIPEIQASRCKPVLAGQGPQNCHQCLMTAHLVGGCCLTPAWGCCKPWALSRAMTKPLHAQCLGLLGLSNSMVAFDTSACWQSSADVTARPSSLMVDVLCCN